MYHTFKVWYILGIFAGMATIRQKVALQDMRFFSYHGFYPEEQLTGSEFIVDVETELEVFDDGSDELAHTVNYERLFELTSAQMKQPRRLIETVAHAILSDVRQEFISVKYIRVAIRKMHPPLPGEVRNSMVELVFNR